MFTVESRPKQSGFRSGRPAASPATAPRPVGARPLWDNPLWAQLSGQSGSGLGVNSTVSHPTDRCEVEANESADRVTRVSGSPPLSATSSTDEGHPLPSSLSTYFGSCSGADLGSVQLHTGPRAADAAQSLQANAFTVGRHVVFGRGQFAPGTRTGRHLLAHELAHVGQQQGASGELGDGVIRRSTGVETEHAGRTLWAQDASGNDLLPSLDDVKQGHVGDCYLFAALAAIVTTSPQRIVNMIVDNGSSYTVTFEGIGWFSTARQTVTPDFAKQRHGEIGTRGAFWPLIIEKAYAQEKGGIDKIEGGDPGDAIDEMTNIGASHFDPADKPVYYTIAKLAYAHFKRWAATIFTPKQAEAGQDKQTMANAQGIKWNHAYAVIDVHQRNKLIQLFNPWGEQHPNGTGWIDIEQTRNVFDQVDIND
jgi:Domain of unknown function (DUF4157)/Calpain family cysteine protease